MRFDNHGDEPIRTLTRRRVPWPPPFGLKMMRSASDSVVRLREPFACHAIMAAAIAPLLFLIPLGYNIVMSGLPGGLLLFCAGLMLFLSVGSLIEANLRCRRVVIHRDELQSHSVFPQLAVHPCHVSYMNQTFVGQALVLWLSEDDFAWAGIVAECDVERELGKLPAWFRSRIVQSNTPLHAAGF